MVEYLPAATHIKVWVNKKYPQIMGHCLDGTAFGTIAIEDRLDQPQVVMDARAKVGAPEMAAFQDDDIPF
jgi:hypothetical protein